MFLSQFKGIPDMRFIADITLLSLLYIGGTLSLSTELGDMLTIVGASIAGAVVLAYFRRDRDYREIFFKSACASLCGLVAGAVITKRWEIDAREYVIAAYFFSSLLALFFIKGLLSFTEANAQEIVVSILQKIVSGRGGPMPAVTPHDSIAPDIADGTIVKTDIVVKKDGAEILETKTKESKK